MPWSLGINANQQIISHVRGQEQKPGGPHARRARPRGVTPHPRSGAAAESTRLRRRRNSGEELPHIRGQGRRPGGATPRPHAQGQGSGGEEQPHVQGAVAARMQEHSQNDLPGHSHLLAQNFPLTLRYPEGARPNFLLCLLVLARF